MFQVSDVEPPAGYSNSQSLPVEEDDDIQILLERIQIPTRKFVQFRDTRFLNRRRLYVETFDSLNNEVLELPSLKVDLNSEEGLLHQLERFMRRDLKAILIRFQLMIPAVVKQLTAVATSQGISHEDFKNKAQQYLGAVAPTFLYELYSFANSKMTVENYDHSIRHVCHLCQDTPNTIVDISHYEGHLDNVDRKLKASTINFHRAGYRLIHGDITSMN